MNAWYVLNGASGGFLGAEPFPGDRLSELCPMTSSMNSWSRNTTWPYAAICSSTDRKQLCNKSQVQLFISHLPQMFTLTSLTLTKTASTTVLYFGT